MTYHKKSDLKLATLEVMPSIFIYDKILFQVAIPKDSSIEILRPVVARFGDELLKIKNIRAIARQLDQKAEQEYAYAEKAYQDICAIYQGLDQYSIIPAKIVVGCIAISFSVPNLIEAK